MGATAGINVGHGAALAAAGHAILTDARGALADPRLTDAEVVHELRKALKRWRALLRILAGPIGDRALALRRQARSLMQALAGARDAQSALDALADLRNAKPPLPAATFGSLEARLLAMKNAAEAKAFTNPMRRRLSRYLDTASQALERWPIETINSTAVTDTLASTYRRARRLVPDNWRDAEAERLHELRRRVVEHRHQMEFIDRLPKRRAGPRARQTQCLRNRLGACQDLAVLSGFMAPRQPLARWRSRTLPAIETRRAAHLNEAAKLSKRLFAEKPKAFRRRLDAPKPARKKKRQTS